MATKTATKKQVKPAKKHAPARPVPARRPVAKAKPSAKSAAAVKPAAKSQANAKVKPVPKVVAKAKTAAAAAKPNLKQVVPPPVAKANGKIPPKVAAKGVKPGEDTPGDADSPLLDMSDVGVRKMIAKAKTRGYVTYDELNKVLPSDKVSSEQIEDTMALLNEMGINVIESEEQEEGADAELPAVVEGGKEVVAKTGTAAEQYDRTDDPVRMYLREMGSVELKARSCFATSSIWKRCTRSAPKARPPPPPRPQARPRIWPTSTPPPRASPCRARSRRRRPRPSRRPRRAPMARSPIPPKPPPQRTPPTRMISTTKAIFRSARWKRR